MCLLVEDLDYGGARLKPGTMLDRYELLCALASGGMATVWLARMRGKRGFEKLLAIKTIRSELSDDPHFEEMFLDEARIAARIQHPNVAQIIDLGEQNEVLYLVMEWVDGEALSKVRKFSGKKGQQLPLGLSLRVIADAAGGLHAAHEVTDEDGKLLGVVHRDVSPQNILISTSGAVKVIDFGVAKATNRLAPQTRSGIIKGKLQYMAPEQALGKALDRRVDVWALGVCLYELVADKLPYDGDNQLEILQKLNENTPPPPLEGAVPTVVEEIILKALARKPEDRYQTCAAMRRAIESALVELELPSSNEDMAGFIELHMPDRAAKRHEVVSRALKEAGELAPSSIAVVEQDGNAGAFDGTVQVDIGGAPPPSAAPTRVSGKMKASPRLKLETDEDDPPVSNATLGSAAIVESKADLLRAIPRSRSGTWVLRITVVALIVGAAFGWQYFDSTQRAANRAPEQIPVTSATKEPPTITPVDSANAPMPSASAKAAAANWAWPGYPLRPDAGPGLVPIPMASTSAGASPSALASAIASAVASASASPPPSASAAPSASAPAPSSSAPPAPNPPPSAPPPAPSAPPGPYE